MTPIPDDIQTALGALDTFQQSRLDRMLATLGEDRVRQVVAEAQAIQAQGGLLKPSGEPRSTMGIVGILVRASARPAELAAIFGYDTFVPLDADLLGAALPLAELLGPLTYPQQQTLAAMHTVLGTARLQALIDQAGQQAAAGDVVSRTGEPITSQRVLLWRLVTAQTTPDEAAVIWPAAPKRGTRPRPPSDYDRWQAVCDRMGEPAMTVRVHIRIISRLIGLDAVEAVATEAEQIEANGGMWLPDGSRKRTLGGVFFHLLKQRLTPEQAAQLPSRYGKKPAAAGTPAPADGPPVVEAEEPELPAFVWGERRAVYAELAPEPGEGKVKVGLVGRPGRVVEKPAVVILSMTSPTVPALPRGVPAPPPTVYTVYLAVKQWAAVKEAIANPEDILIIEGVAGYDPDMEGITVSVTAVTTKLLQRAKRLDLTGGEQRPPQGAS